jgi:hypothetical protein
MRNDLMWEKREVTGLPSDHMTFASPLSPSVALNCCVTFYYMAPFEPPDIVLTGLKERVEALSLQGTGS